MKSILANTVAAALIAGAAIAPLFVTEAAAEPPEAASVPPVHHKPLDPKRDNNGRIIFTPKHQLVSSNWSGYALTGQVFANTSLTWQIPSDIWGASTSSTTTQYSSEWVGIGGFNDNTIIQLGTDQAVASGGQTSNYAWYELYPAATVTIGQSVHPGDIMSASIECTANCSPGTTQTWTMSMDNLTQGWSWSQNFNFASSMASAEWILEAPGWPTLPLADYNMATFQPMLNGATVALDANANGLVMSDNYGETSNVAAPFGGYFSTCWGSGGYTPCTTGSFTAPPPAPPVPSVTLTANPTSINAGQSSTLSWMSANVTICTGTGFSGAGIHGSVNVTPAGTTTYSIACTGSDGNASASATVKVTAPQPSPTKGKGHH